MIPKLSRPISVPMVRRVWAALSQSPRISVRTLARQLGCSTSTIGHAMQVLQAAGYITVAAEQRQARQVLIPFVTTPIGDDAA